MTKSVYSLSYIVIQLLNCYIVYCSLRNTNYTNVRIKYCLLFNSHSVVIQWSFNCHSIVILFIVYCSLFIVLCLLFIVYCSLRNTNYTNVRIYNVFLWVSIYFIVLCSLFTAHCGLLTAYCLLLTAYCLRFTGFTINI